MANIFKLVLVIFIFGFIQTTPLEASRKTGFIYKQSFSLNMSSKDSLQDQIKKIESVCALMDKATVFL